MIRRISLSCFLPLSSAHVYDVTDYGAVGDGSTDCTSAVQQAFHDIEKAGGSGNSVYFPSGSFVFGPVSFKNLESATIEFDKDAKLLSLQDKDKWDKDGDEYIPWIQGKKCSKLTFKGSDTEFEGHHSYWDFADVGKQYNNRPYMMQFKDMDGFTIHGCKLLNSPHTHLKIADSSDVEVYDMHLETTLDSQNTDGIMLASVKKGHVHDVFVQNGDDCMKANDDCQDVTYERGTCVGGHGLSIGGGSKELHIKNIMFRDMDLSDMSYGARIKFTKKTKGYLRNVTYQDLRMRHVKEPMYITTGYESLSDTDLSSSHSTRFSVEDVYYVNIDAVDSLSSLHQDSLTASQGGGGNIKNPGKFECDSTAPCKNLHLRNVTIHSSTKWDGEEFGGLFVQPVSPDPSSHFDPDSSLVVV